MPGLPTERCSRTPSGLKTPAPLWTAPAFELCLLLALIYPTATIFIIWAISGHVGPAELALHLNPNLPLWPCLRPLQCGLPLERGGGSVSSGSSSPLSLSLPPWPFLLLVLGL